MNSGDLDLEKINLEKDRLKLDQERLALEKSFSKKYSTSLIGLVGVIIAGLFAFAQVKVASIQKDNEMEALQIQKDKELRDAASERERRWRLDVTDFFFKNREAIFSAHNSEDQERIIKVIAVTFPEDISTILFKNLKTAVPQEQKAIVEVGQRLADDIQLQKKVIQTYYVIAMTSVSKDEIQSEINRIKDQVGNTFDRQFPNVTIYSPGDGPYTLLVSGKSQSYNQANLLKQKAIRLGFNKETWIWQSNVEYFANKK